MDSQQKKNVFKKKLIILSYLVFHGEMSVVGIWLEAPWSSIEEMGNWFPLKLGKIKQPSMTLTTSPSSLPTGQGQ